MVHDQVSKYVGIFAFRSILQVSPRELHCRIVDSMALASYHWMVGLASFIERGCGLLCIRLKCCLAIENSDYYSCHGNT